MSQGISIRDLIERARVDVRDGETVEDHLLAAEFLLRLHEAGYHTRSAPRVLAVMDRLIVAAAERGWDERKEAQRRTRGR